MTLTPSACLNFARGHRLHHDSIRQIWLIQAPERAYIADYTASSILRHLDGKNSIGDIITTLQAEFDAPAGLITRDVFALLSELYEKRILCLCPAQTP